MNNSDSDNEFKGRAFKKALCNGLNLVLDIQCYEHKKDI